MSDSGLQMSRVYTREWPDCGAMVRDDNGKIECLLVANLHHQLAQVTRERNVALAAKDWQPCETCKHRGRGVACPECRQDSWEAV